jgi:hypothetical protein
VPGWFLEINHPHDKRVNMKKQKTSVIFASGLVLGLAVAFCLGAGESSTTTTTPQPPKKDWSHLQFWGYPNGTGIFDPSTGTIYVYDGQLRDCYIVRRITTLGNPLQ